MNSRIVNVTRGWITLCVDKRTYEVAIEAYLPGSGSPNFDIYGNSVVEILADGEKRKLQDVDAKQLILVLCDLLDARNHTYEVFWPD